MLCAAQIYANQQHWYLATTLSPCESLDVSPNCTYIVCMSDLQFVWDQEKNLLNQAKRAGVTFEEARTVFSDEFARLIHDPAHSEGEDRFLLLGLSTNMRLLIVCHCYREPDSTIRIISARKASTSEEKTYDRHRNAR